MIIELEGDEQDLANPETLLKAVQRALPSKEQELKYPVLRGLRADAKKAYEKSLREMNRRIAKVLEQNLEKSFFDHSEAIHDRDDIAYQRVKRALISMGFMAQDFEDGGALYGASVNQLLDYVRKQR